MTQATLTADMIKVALEGGLAVTKIEANPDGSVRLFTQPISAPTTLDPLEAARKASEDQHQRRPNSH